MKNSKKNEIFFNYIKYKCGNKHNFDILFKKTCWSTLTNFVI